MTERTAAGHSDADSRTSRDSQTGTAIDLFVAPESGDPPQAQSAVDVVEGGIVGDRYCRGAGHFQLDACAVTLVAAEAIAAVEAETGIDVSDGRHRRNVGVDGFGAGMNALLQTNLRVGEVLLRPTRRRPPCAHVEALAGENGLAAALRDRGGLCCDVLEPGRIEVNDTAVIERAAPREAGAAIADRLRSNAVSTGDGDGHDHINR